MIDYETESKCAQRHTNGLLLHFFLTFIEVLRDLTESGGVVLDDLFTMVVQTLKLQI